MARQRWSDLLFLHWPVPAERLRPLVPPPLDLDLREGAAWIGIVAFEGRGLRLAGLPERAGLDFLETNVRTYVHRRGEDAGVYFFSLDAASRAAVAGARTLFGLPYFYARIRATGRGPDVRYEMQRRWSGVNLAVRYEAVGAPKVSLPGSLEHFLVERYRLYIARGGMLQAIEVRHAPYLIQPARVLDLEETLLRAAGLPTPAVPPLVHFSPGVEAEFLAPRLFRRARGGRKE